MLTSLINNNRQLFIDCLCLVVSVAIVKFRLSNKPKFVAKSSTLQPNDDCSKCSKMKNTVKKYDRHVMLCIAEPWPKHIENLPAVKKFLEVIESAKNNCKNSKKIKFTVCSYPSTSNANSNNIILDMLIYPDNLSFKIPEENFATFAELLLTSENLSSFVGSGAIPWKSLILVCRHASRDDRCGRIGPEVIEELHKQLNSRDVSDSTIKVLGSSHLGGHEFAGTVIVYPRGVWYGYIDVSEVRDLIDHVLNNTIFERCFRGIANAKW